VRCLTKYSSFSLPRFNPNPLNQNPSGLDTKVAWEGTIVADNNKRAAEYRRRAAEARRMANALVLPLKKQTFYRWRSGG
jgi:hypothetical protein